MTSRDSRQGIVIDAEGRVLLSREDNGRWEMLGGGLDHGEDPMVCLKQEIYEETGLEVTSISAQPVYLVACRQENADTYIANVIYEITLANLDFIASNECQELRFFSAEEMNTVAVFPNVAELQKLLQKQK